MNNSWRLTKNILSYQGGGGDTNPEALHKLEQKKKRPDTKGTGRSSDCRQPPPPPQQKQECIGMQRWKMSKKKNRREKNEVGYRRSLRTVQNTDKNVLFYLVELGENCTA